MGQACLAYDNLKDFFLGEGGLVEKVAISPTFFFPFRDELH
jgi:hypothetical protein